MARESGVDEGFRVACTCICTCTCTITVDGMCAVCELDDQLPTPAEAGGADGECGAFVLADALEEGFDVWKGEGGPVVVEEGADAVDDTCDVVPTYKSV